MFELWNNEKNNNNCCCGGLRSSVTIENTNPIANKGGIKVLGGGCARCHELEKNTKAALSRLGIKESVELVTDYSVIAAFGVMSTPALVIDNKVVAYGKVLKEQEIVEIIMKVRGAK